MAVFWVQQYFTLPVIYEDIGMGDEVPFTQQAQLIEGAGNQPQDPSPQRSLANVSIHPHQPQPQQQLSHQSSMEFEPYAQSHFAGAPYQGASNLDMSTLANALPEYQMRPYVQQTYQQQYPNQGSSNASMMYRFHQGTQFAGQTASNFNPTFARQYQPQYAHGQQSRQSPMQYQQFAPGQSMVTTPQSLQAQPYIQHQHQQQPMVPQVQTTFHQQPQQFYQAPVQQQYAAPYGAGLQIPYQMPQVRLDTSMTSGSTMHSAYGPVRRTSSNSSLQASSLRGPPRKPKQSGHALWVGNLPPGTHIIDLKDHFSRDANMDIESVFLISKSNCAFVNYKTEASCSAAMTRFHDSRFQGVRLVCRLRRGSVHTSVAAATTPPVEEASANESSQILPGEEPQLEPGQIEAYQETATAPEETLEKVKEKYFVIKSLTVEDLERSVSSGIWATQAHNETALNKAYQAAENVYLIFSANKSGEYFGYARMESAIGDESVPAVEQPVQQIVPSAGPADLPLTIPTPATATAPKGRIIDDSARGTIFWEADQEEGTEPQIDDPGNISGAESGVSAGASPATPQAFGKPFRIAWVSTEKLPFYRTRGLRNPWNANREVKIARDGTEIEPGVGRRLVSMFHRPQIQSSPIQSRTIGPGPVMGGYPQQVQYAPGMYGPSY